MSQIEPHLIHNLHHCKKFMQIMRQKGSGTKMHKCLVGIGFSYASKII